MCMFTSTLCKYDLRKCDLFVLIWPGCDECVLGVFFILCL